jgi:hypothetical protein
MAHLNIGRLVLFIAALLASLDAQAALPRYNGFLRIMASECQAALMPATWPERQAGSCRLNGSTLIREQQAGTCNYHALAAVLDRSPVFGTRREPVSVGNLVFHNHVRQLFSRIVLATANDHSLQAFTLTSLTRGLGGFHELAIEDFARNGAIVPLAAVTPAFEENIESYIDGGFLGHVMLQVPANEQASLIAQIRQAIAALIHYGSIAPHIALVNLMANPMESELTLAWQQFTAMALSALPEEWGMSTLPPLRPVTGMTMTTYRARVHRDDSPAGIEDEELLEEMEAMAAEGILPGGADHGDDLPLEGAYARSGARPTFIHEKDEYDVRKEVSFSHLEPLIAESLSRGIPVLIAMVWPQFLADHDGVLHFSEGRVMRLTPEALNDLSAKHAVSIVDILKDEKGAVAYYKLQNSWGTDAGDGGHYYITPGYLSVLLESLTVFHWEKPSRKRR